MGSEGYGDFKIYDQYHFTPVSPLRLRGNVRNMDVTYKVNFDPKIEEETLIYRENFVPEGKAGMLLPNEYGTEGPVRKHLEDIVLVIGFLTNCHLFLGGEGRGEDLNTFPPFNRGYVSPYCSNSKDLEIAANKSLSALRDPEWRLTFRNAFPLIHYCNTEKITTIEPRFISHVVIWELLYSFKYGDNEGASLNNIITSLLRDFFGSKLIFSRKNSSVFYIIRNQLVHNGIFPINGERLEYTPDNLKKMTVLTSEKYIRFFTKLTYALLLRMLFDFDLETIRQRITRNSHFTSSNINFDADFDEFIQTGFVAEY